MFSPPQQNKFLSLKLNILNIYLSLKKITHARPNLPPYKELKKNRPGKIKLHVYFYYKMNNNNKHLDEKHMQKHAVIAKVAGDAYYHGIDAAEKNLSLYLPSHTIDKKTII